MTKYRIKAAYKKYIVQRKGLFFWRNCLKDYCRDGGGFAKTFSHYNYAKEALEAQLKHDADYEVYKQKVADFKTRYYYPPLPIEEPVND